MEKWQVTVLILCCFGLFKEFRPSEPFVTPYILEDYHNITLDVLIHDAFPVSTYSYVSTLVIVFLVTDFLRYRSIVILEGFAYVITWILLTWGRSLTTLYLVEIMYGLASSTEVAYYTYIYAQVDKDKYLRVTSYTYSAISAGRFLAAVTSQVLVTTELMTYHQLNYLSLAGVSVALTFSFFLPPVQQSIYFYRDADGLDESLAGPSVTLSQRIRKAYPILWADFKEAFSNPSVVKWSLWWAVGLAVYLQVINYIQAMWETISEEDDIWNAAVEAIHTALSVVLGIGVGRVSINWTRWSELLLSSTSIIAGGALIVGSQTKLIFVAYVCYIVFRLIFQVTLTVASAEVAKQISEDSNGLIFGVNTFVALCLQTILTVVVADSDGLALTVTDQFVVYGSCFALIGVLFVLFGAFNWARHGCKSKSNRRESGIIDSVE